MDNFLILANHFEMISVSILDVDANYPVTVRYIINCSCVLLIHSYKAKFINMIII